MQLPLLLAGPILRRVDPGLVAVQVVLSEPADVRLTVYEGRVASDTTNPPFASSNDPPDPDLAAPHPGEKTVRIGEQLHLGLVTARLPPASGKVFQSDRLYSYNVTITGAAQTRTDLAGLGLLGAHTVSGVEVRTARLRRPHAAELRPAADRARPTCGSRTAPAAGPGTTTATPWRGWTSTWTSAFDDPRGADPPAVPRRRPDLRRRRGLAHDAADRAARRGADRRRRRECPVERVKVDQVLRRPPTAQPDPADPNAAYTPETAAGDRSGGGPAGRAAALPGRRPAAPDQRSAGSSRASTATNHLISLGEFAATYLLVWSPACWGEEVPGAERPGARRGDRPGLRWLDTAERRPGHRPAPAPGPRTHPAAPVRRQGDVGRACEEGGGEDRQEASEGGRRRPAIPSAEPSGAPASSCSGSAGCNACWPTCRRT